MMSAMKRIGIILMPIAILFFLGACAVRELKVKPIATSENPVEHINRLEKDIGNARNNQLNVLAPTWFGKAEASLNEARKGLDRGDELSEIFMKISYGQAQLERAEEMGKLARTALPDVIKTRDLALAAGAANLGDDYVKVEGQFIELTKAIEKNDLDWAQRNKDRVVRAFDDLELRAIKGHALGEVRNIIKQAEEEGAGKIAPKTFKVAKEKLNHVDAFISEHRYQREKISEQASEALFGARRLLQVIRQSAKIRTGDSEQITLWFEGMLNDIANKLSASDMRDQAFEIQVNNILCSVTTLQEGHRLIADRIKAQQTTVEDMKKLIASLEQQTREEQVAKDRLAMEEKAAKDRLAAERQFHKLFNEVRRQFGPTEAEVYKQGEHLVIRLRAIQFPVGKDYIMPGNFALLSKVQRAIRTFGEPDVVVEGHTDSTGSEALNESLSQRRAEVVCEYFVANGALTNERVSAVGYGSKRPLASNKTEEGRAINRRIDVLIKPRPLTRQ